MKTKNRKKLLGDITEKALGRSTAETTTSYRLKDSDTYWHMVNHYLKIFFHSYVFLLVFHLRNEV